ASPTGKLKAARNATDVHMAGRSSGAKERIRWQDWPRLAGTADAGVGTKESGDVPNIYLYHSRARARVKDYVGNASVNHSSFSRHAPGERVTHALRWRVAAKRQALRIRRRGQLHSLD